MVCDTSYDVTLNSDGKCEGWMPIFRQTAGTYSSPYDWLNVNDNDSGKWDDNYSILHRIDDTYKNS